MGRRREAGGKEGTYLVVFVDDDILADDFAGVGGAVGAWGDADGGHERREDGSYLR